MRWNIHSFIEYYTFLNRDEGYVSLGKIPIFELITEQSNFWGAAFYVERKIEELRFSFSFPPRQLFERGDSFSNKLGSNDFVAFGNSVIFFFFFSYEYLTKVEQSDRFHATDFDSIEKWNCSKDKEKERFLEFLSRSHDSLVKASKEIFLHEISRFYEVDDT